MLVINIQQTLAGSSISISHWWASTNKDYEGLEFRIQTASLNYMIGSNSGSFTGFVPHMQVLNYFSTYYIRYYH